MVKGKQSALRTTHRFQIRTPQQNRTNPRLSIRTPHYTSIRNSHSVRNSHSSKSALLETAKETAIFCGPVRNLAKSTTYSRAANSVSAEPAAEFRLSCLASGQASSLAPSLALACRVCGGTTGLASGFPWPLPLPQHRPRLWPLAWPLASCGPPLAWPLASCGPRPLAPAKNRQAGSSTCCHEPPERTEGIQENTNSGNVGAAPDSSANPTERSPQTQTWRTEPPAQIRGPPIRAEQENSPGPQTALGCISSHNILEICKCVEL